MDTFPTVNQELPTFEEVPSPCEMGKEYLSILRAKMSIYIPQNIPCEMGKTNILCNKISLFISKPYTTIVQYINTRVQSY